MSLEDTADPGRSCTEAGYAPPWVSATSILISSLLAVAGLWVTTTDGLIVRGWQPGHPLIWNSQFNSTGSDDHLTFGLFPYLWAFLHLPHYLGRSSPRWQATLASGSLACLSLQLFFVLEWAEVSSLLLTLRTGMNPAVSCWAVAFAATTGWEVARLVFSLGQSGRRAAR